MKSLLVALALSLTAEAGVITSRSRMSTPPGATGSGTGDFSSNTSSSVDGEVVLFSGTGGKTGKRASGTGPAKLTSGVLSASSVSLSTEVTGTLPKANGGAGADMSSVTFPGSGTIATTSSNVATATALASNPSDCSAGQYANAIAANGNLTCANPFSGMVDSVSGHIEVATAKPFILEQYAEYAYTVNRITSQCDSGTVDFDLEINGTNVTGCASQQMASSEAVDTCTAANAVAVGDTLSLNVTGVSTPDDCRFTVKITR